MIGDNVKKEIFNAVNSNNWDKYGNIINYLACTKFRKKESIERGFSFLWFHQPSTKFVLDYGYYIVSVSDELEIEYDAEIMMFHFKFIKKGNTEVWQKLSHPKQLFFNRDINQIIHSIVHDINGRLYDID